MATLLKLTLTFIPYVRGSSCNAAYHESQHSLAKVNTRCHFELFCVTIQLNVFFGNHRNMKSARSDSSMLVVMQCEYEKVHSNGECHSYHHHIDRALLEIHSLTNLIRWECAPLYKDSGTYFINL